MNHTVYEHSRLIPLRECRNYTLDDDEQHYIIYQHNINGFIQYSKAYEGKGDIFGKNLGSLFEKSEQDFVPIDENYSDNFLKNTINSIQDLVRDYYLPGVENLLYVQLPETKSGKLMLSAKMLSLAFGISTVLVGKRERE